MKRNILFFVPRQAIRRLWACMLPMVAAALLMGCSKVDDPHALPAGKHPITFAAAVEGLTVEKASTRATTTNGWAGNEEVAVKIGNEVKKYKAAANNTLTVDGSNEPWYWQSATEEKSVSAWYPHSTAQPTSFAVQADQSGNGYQNSDMIYAAPTTISFRSNALTFRHLPAKVVVNLKADTQNGVTEDEVRSATVTIVNQTTTSGTIAADWSVAQTAPGNSIITPNMLTTTASGYQKSVQALLVPQQMQNKQFIKVTIGTGDAARDYYYTPTNATGANLESGKQYTYAITVKKTEIVVTVVDNDTTWDNAGSPTTGGSEATTFKVKIPTISGVSPQIGGTTGNTGEIYTTASNSFSITLTVGDGMQGFNVKGGICDVKRVVENNNTYKFTYSNIRSNLELAYGEYIEVGDYYYADGTWSPTYSANGASTCIGIVFKIGAAGGDVASNYGDILAGGVIRGYVVALTDALGYAGEWGARGTDENNGYLPNISANSDAQYNGYTQTKHVLEAHAGDLSRYEAFSAVQNYSVAASSGSSGWYLPSQKQLADVWRLYKGAAGNVLYDRLNVVGASSLFQTGQGGTHNKDNEYRYWSSTEKSSTNAWYVTFDTGGVIDAYAKDNGYDRLCRARAILTF